MYEIQKNLTRLDNDQHTFFLDPLEQTKVRHQLGKIKDHIFSPNKDISFSDK